MNCMIEDHMNMLSSTDRERVIDTYGLPSPVTYIPVYVPHMFGTSVNESDHMIDGFARSRTDRRSSRSLEKERPRDRRKWCIL